ncbi:MAG: hypothetical protein M1822_001543 [Bathelium mastoideum]|nr:MAG: hypothetical protein M1822_001543 [Bathelium mastoideum]
MAHAVTISPQSANYPGELMVASLGPDRRFPIDFQVVQNYLPDLAHSSALSSSRSGPGFDIDDLARQIFNHDTPTSNAPLLRNALQLIFYHVSKMHSTASLDRVRGPLKTWLARSVMMELEGQNRRVLHFTQTLNRFRSLVAISNAFTSDYIALLLYDFFGSQYGVEICTVCSRKTAFRFGLLFFSLRLLSDGNIFSVFRQIARGNPTLFRRQVGMNRFANPRSVDIWRLMEWVGAHWDAHSFDDLPDSLHHIIRTRRRPEVNRRECWLSRARPRPLSWEVSDTVRRPRLQPRLYTTGSLHDHRSENALTDMADQMEHLDMRLALLENDHTRIADTQDDMVDYLNGLDQHDRLSDDDGDWLDKWT